MCKLAWKICEIFAVENGVVASGVRGDGETSLRGADRCVGQ